MFKRIFGGQRTTRQATAADVYDRIVAAARQPVLYAAWNVPDTPLGRYEMISLHLFLVLHRLRAESGPARALAQELTDQFFEELDHSLRELGVGDLSMPKRMKKLGRMFYGRVAAYGEALDKSDAALLSRALARNVRPDEPSWGGAAELADYVLAVHRALAVQLPEAIVAGQVTFPAAVEREEFT